MDKTQLDRKLYEDRNWLIDKLFMRNRVTIRHLTSKSEKKNNCNSRIFKNYLRKKMKL